MMWVYASLLCLLAGYVIAVQPRWGRWAALGFILVGALGLIAAVDTMGTPKPLRAEWRDPQDWPVIAQHYDPPVTYLWVLRDGGPVAYAMPFDPEEARKIQQAGDAQRWRLTTEGGETVVHPEPIRELPPKD